MLFSIGSLHVVKTVTRETEGRDRWRARVSTPAVAVMRETVVGDPSSR